MEWQQLEYFEKLAQLQHFTKTAETLSISQPALSRSIARLEKELGCPLFDRKGKSIALNRYGEIFLVSVIKSLQEVKTASNLIRDLTHPDHGTVIIAFLLSLGRTLIPKLLTDFHALFPNIKLNLFQNVSPVLTKKLKEGLFDFCFYAPTNKEGLEFLPLYSDKIFLIVSRNHPKAKYDYVYISDIYKEPLITLNKGYDLRILTEQCFAEAGFQPNISLELQDIFTITNLVEANFGIALIPYTSGLDKMNISFIPIKGVKTTRITGIAWLSGQYMSPAAKKFKNFVINSFEGKDLYNSIEKKRHT